MFFDALDDDIDDFLVPLFVPGSKSDEICMVGENTRYMLFLMLQCRILGDNHIANQIFSEQRIESI